MTPQEQKMLDDLMARVDSTRLDDKDPEAAQWIEEWTARNPDAAYILAQTVLVQNYALDQAKAQIQSLQQQIAQHPALPQQSKPASFLGGLFGHKDELPSPQAARIRAAATELCAGSAICSVAAVRAGTWLSTAGLRGAAGLCTWRRRLKLSTFRGDDCGRRCRGGAGVSGHRVADAWLRPYGGLWRTW